MADKYTYADVIIDPNDPRVEIGKEYYCSCYPSGGLNLANMGIGYQELVRVDKDDNSFGPFVVKKDDGIESFPCIIRKKEPKKKYVPFDLRDEKDRDWIRGAWIRPKDDKVWHETQIVQIDKHVVGITNPDREVSPDELLEFWEFVDGSPCGKLVEETE